jgi:hypothetical protein
VTWGDLALLLPRTKRQLRIKGNRSEEPMPSVEQNKLKRAGISAVIDTVA